MNEKGKSFGFKFENATTEDVSKFLSDNLIPMHFEPLVTNRGISIAFEQIAIEGIDIWYTFCDTGMILTFPNPQVQDRVAFYIAKQGSIVIHAGSRELISEPSTAVIGDLRDWKRVEISPGQVHIGVAIKKCRLNSYLSEMIIGIANQEIAFSDYVDLTTETGIQLRNFSEFLWGYISDYENKSLSSCYTRHLAAVFTMMILEIVPHNFSNRIVRTVLPEMPRHIRRAIDFMNANIKSTLSVAEVAQAAGISVRSLQQAFKQFFDMTPLDFLRNLRLEGVRNQLKTSSRHENIYDVARGWGFNHFSRFSALYKNHYGELPSETLKRHPNKPSF